MTITCCRLLVLTVVLTLVEFDRSIRCVSLLWQHCVAYAVILITSAMMDFVISCVAMRGGILDVDARAPMKYLVYARVGKYHIRVLLIIIHNSYVSAISFIKPSLRIGLVLL